MTLRRRFSPSGADHPRPGEIDPATYLYERYMRSGIRSVALRSYYRVRPLVPRALQLAVRRAYSRRQSRRTFPAWPVEPLLVEHQHEQLRQQIRSAPRGRVPLVNFWPDGHRFAVVLTHDVEGAGGLARIGPLLELEQRYGFVSSWNLVAEDYAIPEATFAQIRSAGGEIGVHGIHHDGKLFGDRAAFEAGVRDIRRYLQAWDAVGFRSPGTRRNAEWMAELGCLYDSSFPDTDPYEPQPGGCCSIFPFFFGDVVELPITLAQDHTLWEILRLPTIDVWRVKTDWLVAHHGLVNVIVHPDYVSSEERLGLYEQLLRCLRERVNAHDGWHALPRDVAAWWRERETLRVERHAETVAVSSAAGGWAARACVAWAFEREGAVVFAVDGRPAAEPAPGYSLSAGSSGSGSLTPTGLPLEGTTSV